MNINCSHSILPLSRFIVIESTPPVGVDVQSSGPDVPLVAFCTTQSLPPSIKGLARDKMTFSAMTIHWLQKRLEAVASGAPARERKRPRVAQASSVIARYYRSSPCPIEPSAPRCWGTESGSRRNRLTAPVRQTAVSSSGRRFVSACALRLPMRPGQFEYLDFLWRRTVRLSGLVGKQRPVIPVHAADGNTLAQIKTGERSAFIYEHETLRVVF